ncbi:MAG: penicillin-binding protein 2 [Anaerolineae bacterium]|nr:penicillin-binding protein 2 [Anaerolineae bacterium]
MSLENPSSASRLRLSLLAACMTFFCTVIVGRLVYYQVVLGDTLEQNAMAQRMREREVTTRRGFIVDATGHVLALDMVEWEVAASPSLIVDPAQAAVALGDLLGLPKEQVYASLISDKVWLRLAMDVPYETGEAIVALDLAGITCTPHYRRFYPESTLTAHAIGFVNDTGDGFYGVEGYYNQVLKGVVGWRTVEQNPAGEVLPMPPHEQVPPLPGNSVVLTLDRNIQYIAQEELERALTEYGAEAGTVVIMDPRSGAILALASAPQYDPNGFEYAEIDRLMDPVVSKMWEPGSIFKIVTWAAGIDSGTISPGTTFYDDGTLEVGGRVIQNSDRQGHGLVTMTDGLVKSLNTVAAFISTSMGKDTFYTYLRRFGFGTITGVDLASEGPGMVKQPGDSNWFPSDLGTNSFGQGIAVTPIQMITAVAAVANDGLLMKPYVVDQFLTVDEDGQAKWVQVEPMMVRRAISQGTAEALTNMLVRVIEEGATKAQVPGYTVAGKTGTAQIPTAYGYDPNGTIGSFVGFAPADDPRFIILIKLDRPTSSQWGSQTAAPTFQAIASRLLIYMQVPPDEIRAVMAGEGFGATARLGTDD